MRFLPRLLATFVLFTLSVHGQAQEKPLRAGFAEIDITPKVKAKKPVYVAGFGKNRIATGVHDPLMARAVVFQHEKEKVALVSVDLVGLFLTDVDRVREKLPGFTHVLVSSTHNHEGPDTLGLWGPHPFKSGVDPAYLDMVVERIVKVVASAEKNSVPVEARIGTEAAPELIHDGRQPIVKHDELVALLLVDEKGNNAGLVVQWNCHPETLDSKNTLLSADFVWGTVEHLQKKLDCPVVYLTGTVGGLMTSLRVPIQDEKGNDLADGTFEKTKEFGIRVGQTAERALQDAKPIKLTPMDVRRRDVFLPMDNPIYQLGWKVGVLKRQAYLWEGKTDRAEKVPGKLPEGARLAIRTELTHMKLGDLEIACIPGEIYPELVLGKVPDPAPKGADYPDASIEPAVYDTLKSKHRMLIGLANDEIGYILPKRQWDERAPFSYGRKSAPYGEVNSLGPETGPLLCEAFRELVAGKKAPRHDSTLLTVKVVSEGARSAFRVNQSPEVALPPTAEPYH